MSTIERAVEIAVEQHKGQVDKAGVPYILHPISVMVRVKQMGYGTDHQTVAILHDVVEDTPFTLLDLRKEGFSEEILAAIDSVTKRDGENYISFVRRSSRNPIGKVVKRADVIDNHERIPMILNSKWWNKLSTKYTVALAILNDNHAWLEANAELIAGMEAQ